jgi:hypothetical protein
MDAARQDQRAYNAGRGAGHHGNAGNEAEPSQDHQLRSLAVAGLSIPNARPVTTRRGRGAG